jgi:hypothetical protein
VGTRGRIVVEGLVKITSEDLLWFIQQNIVIAHIARHCEEPSCHWLQPVGFLLLTPGVLLANKTSKERKVQGVDRRQEVKRREVMEN